MKTNIWIKLTFALGLLLSSFGIMPQKQNPVQAATIVRVKPGGSTSAGCGSSWATACELQTALTAASAGTEIWVAAGTYMPGTNREDTFQLISEVALYGGFTGTETARNQRDWEANLTVLSGDIGAPDDNSDNSYSVVTGSGVETSAILDGFTITGGNAELYPDNFGGGMVNFMGSPSLSNLIFSENYGGNGGGMYNEGSSPNLTNVIFKNNQAAVGGGMLNNENSNPMLKDVTFIDNSGTPGGGMSNLRSNPVLINVTFNNNTSNWGGGMDNYESSPSLTNVTFSNNSAVFGCGGMYNSYNSNPLLSNVTFVGNSVEYVSGRAGGGMCNKFDSNPVLINVTFSGNSAFRGGGVYNDNSSNICLTDVIFNGNTSGIYNLESNLVVSNTSFINNLGIGMINRDSSLTMTNAVFIGNSGVGMHNLNSSLIIDDVSFINNSDGGIYNNSSNPTITNAIFSSNTSSYGGGMSNDGSSPILTNAVFSGNSASYGGGMYNVDSNPTLTNVTFTNNMAENGGGIYNKENSQPVITNVNISGNRAIYSGGGIYNNNSNPIIINTIIWGNIPNSSVQQIYNDNGATPSIKYSNVQGGCAAIPGNDCSSGGNIDKDPLFIRNPDPGPDGYFGTEDDDYGDLRLKYGSPVIDAGDNTAPGLAGITTDLGDNPRYFNVPGIPDTGVGPAPVVDMGAYERQANHAPIATDDSYNTNEDVPFHIDAPGILDNDNDPDGDSLNPVLESAPNSGSLTLNPDGSFNYQPENEYSGEVTFTYHATDGELDSNIATVVITIIEIHEIYLPMIVR